MATPTLSRHSLPGALGELFIDMRSAGDPAARPAIVSVHGFKGFKDWGFWPPFAERAARAGFTAVTFNLSGSGVDANGEPTLGERFARDTYSHQLQDIQIVITALFNAELGVAPPPALALVGHSRGGGMAVIAAAADPRVSALVTWAAIAEADRWDEATRAAWRERGFLDVENTRTGQVLPVTTDILDDLDSSREALNITAAAGRVSIPWLIIHGDNDESVPVGDAARLASANRNATLRIVPGTGHTFGAGHPWKPAAVAELVMAESLRFLMKHLT